MTCLEDQLENIEHCLERARQAGNPNDIHCLTAQRDSVIAQIAATRTKQPAPWIKYHTSDCSPTECHCQ